MFTKNICQFYLKGGPIPVAAAESNVSIAAWQVKLIPNVAVPAKLIQMRSFFFFEFLMALIHATFQHTFFDHID